MCGIAGIASTTSIAKRLYRSITHLEYRGYDSCGMALTSDKTIQLRKNVGKIAEVNRLEQLDAMDGSVGIAHTRWATHGGVTPANSHPHFSQTEEFALVHNGVIKNYERLRTELQEQGFTFRSETDTEVIVMLLEAYYQKLGCVEKALRKAITRLEGSFAVAMVTVHEPKAIYCARQEMSPLLIGVGKDEMYVGSDINAFIDYTNRMVPVKDGEMAIVKPNDFVVKDAATGEVVERAIETIAWSREMAQKGGYQHYMLKEIHEQPEVLKTILSIPEEELLPLAREIAARPRTLLMGVGTTYYVALMGQYLLKRLANAYCPAIYSDEFEEIIAPEESDLLLAVSQSGETYDTLMSIQAAKRAGAKTAGIINVVGSSMSREVDFPIHQGSGPEICVLSTKAAMAQVFLLMRLAVLVARERGTADAETLSRYQTAMEALPGQLQLVLNRQAGHIRRIALQNASIQNWLYIGRGIYHAVGLESALKMKEVTYLHAEGLPSGFLKHGTIALVDEHMRTVAFVPHTAEEAIYDATMSNIEEVRARGGKVIAFHSGSPNRLFDEQITLPEVHWLTLPLLEMAVGQLLAYYTAVKLERDPDKPRNLAKSVTVP